MLRVGRLLHSHISLEQGTVKVGNNVTLTCARQESLLSTFNLFWIRPVSGKHPEFYKTFSSTSFDPRIRTTEEPGTFVLRITNATRRDTGVYYCLKVENKNFTFLKGIDLKVQGKYITEKPETTSVPPSDPVRPGDSVTLQCSVLSDSDNKTCPGGHRVCCFRDGSDVDPRNLLFLPHK
uniref:Ig-like domain-containing protein n=1 Tax=Sparus aurata TaxID=8175 RepID=A0A671XXM9_SPAAU